MCVGVSSRAVLFPRGGAVVVVVVVVAALVFGGVVVMLPSVVVVVVGGGGGAIVVVVFVVAYLCRGPFVASCASKSRACIQGSEKKSAVASMLFLENTAWKRW